ncbi:30S ribosomal protein S12 methylthiotransferase RimO [Marinospirillum insulare]|uniref:Ribosomal protein uS12 methylthiotransferase RimO n=1 Tax=Marinospirillum insulare TaxID=217169 RepID=A0ABQ5ZWS9_9GAMM|nr:30S ribosomal protein S12 methylthiotransferase RimO [Marinospirillum insulare]GLR63788.1 ribosomal protein S12 methylthiotransferase RimO [Marinospirillum insulare]
MASSISTSSDTHKVGFVSLGCPKALVDSERILTQLRGEGYDLVPSYEDANLVVVNTCGFIDAAKAESLDAIGEAISENGRVIVTGCMGVDEALIRDLHPQVLAVTGPQQYEQVVKAVHQYLPPKIDYNPYLDLLPPQGIKLTPRHYSYLKISEGCNHRCSFCIIPSLRGDLVSRPIGEVLSEAERLVDAGVQELLVVSQDTSAYGLDLKYRTGFWQGRPIKTRMKELCEELGQLGSWVRMHYVYPYPHVDDIIPLMAENKILPYLDIPFQHAHPDVLRAMKRPAASEKTLQRIQAWRAVCPDLTLRSTFIVGFPGETDAQFEYLLDFLDEAQLDRVGCFTYSPVEGATANQLANPVPEDVKEERLARFMEKQAQISAIKLQQKIGKTLEVLVDEVGDDGAAARTQADAPEIDGQIFLLGASHLKPGQRVQVEVTEADEHDLWGRLVEQ